MPIPIAGIYLLSKYNAHKTLPFNNSLRLVKLSHGCLHVFSRLLIQIIHEEAI